MPKHAVYHCSRCGKRCISVRDLNNIEHLVFLSLTSEEAKILTSDEGPEALSIVRVEKCGLWVREVAI